MGLFGFSRNKSTPPPMDTREEVRSRMMAAHTATGDWVKPFGTYDSEKYGSIDFPLVTNYNFHHLLKNSRGIYHNSTIARGIVKRQESTVVNTGLTWESSPMWDLIPDSPSGDAEKQKWTKKSESQWILHADSQEADIEGRLTFQQLQRKIYRLRKVDGEVFGIIRYLNDSNRMSPVTLQLIKPEQVVNPTSYEDLRRIEEAGGSVDHGIEKDAIGKIVAIHVLDKTKPETVRIPIYGKKGRRFVIHTGNFEAVGQSRTIPELSTVVYELKKLSEYDTAEIEAAVSQAAWIGETVAHKDVKPSRKSGLKLAGVTPAGGGEEPKKGIEKVRFGRLSLFKNNNPPGYETKWFTPTRPNQNYQAFVDAFLTYIGGALGIPLSVLKQTFQSSYSAARAEILFYWHTVMTERHEFQHGFLAPYHEAWFSEAVKAGNIQADGFNKSTLIRKAYLRGTWNGIARPVVDPYKEVNAIRMREELGHTTGERESKAYNGSDHRENLERLTIENKLRAKANEPLDPAQYIYPKVEELSDDD